MEKIQIGENIYLCSFKSETGKSLGKNIVLLLDGNEAMIVDAGYKRDLQYLIDDLKVQGIHISKVLPTHFHSDHTQGIALLYKPVVYGNIHAPKMAKKMYKIGYEDLLPTQTVSDGDQLSFGRFTIKLYNAPGHSDCSMLVEISLNNKAQTKYLHVGDLYVCNDKGIDVVPYAIKRNYLKYIESLELIKTFRNHKFLISHGPCPIDEVTFIEGINNRLHYLKNKIEKGDNISEEEAVIGCSKAFLSTRLKAIGKRS